MEKSNPDRCNKKTCLSKGTGRAIMCLSRASMCNQMLTSPTDAQTTKPFPTQYDDMSRFVVLLQITKNDEKHPKRTEKSLERPKDSRPSQSLPKASQKPPKSLPKASQTLPKTIPKALQDALKFEFLPKSL